MITIFYKTYSKDIQVLQHSLLSVAKYVKGEYKLVICYHQPCELLLKDMLESIDTVATIYPVTYNYHGYLVQMREKLMVHNRIDTDIVMYLDCDCIFYKEYDLTKCYADKIPWRYLMRPAVDTSGVFATWEQAVKETTLQAMNNCYMVNGFPFIVKTSTLQGAEQLFHKLHGKSYDEYIQAKMDRLKIPIDSTVLSNWPTIATIFEEFEYIGWYAHRYTEDYHFFTDHEQEPIESSLKQYWSHGNIEDQYKEIEALYTDNQ